MFVRNPSKTLLCHYAADEEIYPRIERLQDDIPEYQRFMGCVGFDVTVTNGMSPEWVDELMLLNQLATAVLAVNGVKVVANLRCATADSTRNLSTIPRGVMCASGTLGCDDLEEPWDMSYLAKVLGVGPDPLLVYGKHDRFADEQLARLGVSVIHYDDARTLYNKEGMWSRPAPPN